MQMKMVQQLNDDQLKEKRKQRLLKAGFDARLRARKEKEREKEERDAEAEREREERERDLEAWSTRLRRRYEVFKG
jgi:actin-related protein 5